MTTEAIQLPGGWGWPSGYVLGSNDPTATLPDLPMLRVLPSAERNAVVIEALSRLPAAVLAQIRQRDVVKKYGLPKVSATSVLARARLATPTRHEE
jgi:hypothetical protein